MIRQQVYTTTGIVLKRRNWGEADKIITVYTRESGKVRMLAKGVRKLSSRRSGHLEPFQCVKLTVHGGGKLHIISEAESESRSDGEMNLKIIGYAYFLCELVDKLTPDEEKSEDIYYLFKDSLAAINRKNNQSECDSLSDLFANRLLVKLGFLQPSRNLGHEEIVPFVESIIEKHLKSPKILARMNNML
jgi:DNA repair protein RecO